ncbi:MAG: FHA domain-containing protein, partial [Myxococcaceae bacterium]|nr:FHA domain-containing protein [Myxococcaceae bacterium]
NREVPNEQLFTDAGKALAADELAQASTLLGKVKTKIPATEKRLETLRATLETRLGEKVIDARKKLASAPRDLATMEQVKAMAEDVLTARPEDRDAPDIKKQADDNIARIKNPNLPPPAPDTPHLEVMNRFRNGDQSGAVSLAQACAARSAQCRSLEAQLREFDAKFKGLEGLSSADLWALYVLDKKIAGGQSSDLAKPIKTKVSSVFMLEASRSKTVGDWVRAIGSARKVLEVDAQHPAANAIIQDARTKANDIYLRGYQLKDSSADEAAKLFKEVLAMTPEDDTAHQKAKSRLDELQRQ